MAGHDRGRGQGQQPVQGGRPLQRERVGAVDRRGALLDQVAGEHHPGVGHDHHQVVVGVPAAAEAQLDPPPAHPEVGPVVAHGPVGRVELQPLQLAGRLGQPAQQVLTLGRRPGAQVGRAALVAPDGGRAQGGVAEAVVEVGVGVDHLAARQRGQGTQVGQEPGRLGGEAAGVDHQHLVVAHDRAHVQVEAAVAPAVDAVADLLPAARSGRARQRGGCPSSCWRARSGASR